MSEYPTELASYLLYRAQYGIPETRWRPMALHKSVEPDTKGSK